MNKEVAYFSKVKASIYVVFLFVLAIGLLVFAFVLPNGIEYMLGRGRNWLPVLLFVWSGAIFLLVCDFSLFTTMVFRKGLALWVEDDRVVYIRKWIMSVSCKEIVSMKEGGYGLANSPGIILELKDGRQKIIPTWALSEPPAFVMARLKSEIGLVDAQD